MPKVHGKGNIIGEHNSINKAWHERVERVGERETRLPMVGIQADHYGEYRQGTVTCIG